jgi:putative FmdB family regulatory protein
VPVYEYRCRACGHSLDALQPMGAAEPPGPCPVCGEELRRAYSRVAVTFEGWGFSKTDSLLPESRRSRRDYRALKSKAEEISDG